MAVVYPDVIGEHIAEEERFFTNGLQYVGYFSPTQIGPGEAANLYLFLQNVLNVPMSVNVKISPPQTGFLRGGKPLLQVGESEFELQITTAEVGLLTIPVVTTDRAGEGDYSLTLEIKTTPKGRGERVRPAKAESKLNPDLIDNIAGLNLVSSLGATYVEKPAKKASFDLAVAGEAGSSQSKPWLKHSYETIWTEQNIKNFNAAIRELNLRQVKLKNELTLEALYANLYSESVSRFADAGLGLRVGEAIILAKILTYTCQYFLSNPVLGNGLLLPIWERAFEFEADTTDTLEVIRTVGYHHLLKLSVALSFGLIARTFGRHFWSLEERQAVVNHIADTIDMGEPLDVEFLYLPLLMAGTQISNKLRLPEEDPGHTLALIYKARQTHANLFADEDMAQANKIYNQILKKALE